LSPLKFDFRLFLLKLIFLCQEDSHQSTKYCQIFIFVFLNLLNQFLITFLAFWHPFFTVIIFLIIFFDILYFFIFFMCGDPKMGYNMKSEWVAFFIFFLNFIFYFFYWSILGYFFFNFIFKHLVDFELVL
jgi:hypothetical protein